LKTWVNPRQAVPEKKISSGFDFEGAKHRMLALKQALDAYRDELIREQKRPRWLDVRLTLGPWANVDKANPGLGLLKNKDVTLQSLAEKLQRHRDDFTLQAGIPPTLKTLSQALRELMQLDVTHMQEETDYTVRFWRRDWKEALLLETVDGGMGRGARFESLLEDWLDPGIQYVILEDQTGQRVAWMRFILVSDGKDQDSQSFLYHDVTRGNSSEELRLQMWRHAKKWAEKLGMDPAAFDNQNFLVREKQIGALTGSRHWNHARMKTKDIHIGSELSSAVSSCLEGAGGV